jgi:transposase
MKNSLGLINYNLDRMNWLFCGNDYSGPMCGNDDAAKNVAIIYSLLGCCKASGVNFLDWLVFFLENIHKYDDDYSMDLAELLPHNFKIKNGNSVSKLS